jgi:transcriptional regulator with XRE-family HTH domain
MWFALGARFRALRHRLGLRQADLSRRARVSRRIIGLIENGRWEKVPFGALDRVTTALGARLFPNLSWQGEALDRLVDAAHADLQTNVAEMLRRLGWLVAVEVSFIHFGERGRYDLLAFHQATGTVLVVEIKTAIGDVQATLGTLDVKLRLALMCAHEQAWSGATTAVPALVIADERHQHRLVARHAALFARFDLRGRTARAWLGHPAAGVGGLLFYLPMTDVRNTSLRKANRGRRVRKARARMTSAPSAAQMSSARVDFRS